MDINGLMIDCSRLKEPDGYYYHLIDFMKDWNMNLMLLHFSDDHGLSIRLPGAEELARPTAFETRDIAELIRYAGERGIEVVPELETFGHTRFITDHPKYEHLYAGEKSEDIYFNAIDPLNPQTHRLMESLIKSTAELFPSRYFHIGCDEVNLSQYCEKRDLESAALYTDYVNRIMGMVRESGKTPMFWADHAVKEPEIGAGLDKDAVAVFWKYNSDVSDEPLSVLREHGFTQTVCAPSVACYRYRFLPSEGTLRNLDRMAAHARKHGSLGLINTAWCPYRYFQKAVNYGIAYGAARVNKDATPDRMEFNGMFASKVFGTDLEDPLERFLGKYPELLITADIAGKIYTGDPELNHEQAEIVSRTGEVWDAIRDCRQQYAPERNEDIWEAMTLAADAAGLCSRWFTIARPEQAGAESTEEFNRLLRETRARAESLWDRTRYPDDPQKYAPHFPNEASQYAMILLERAVLTC